MPFTLNAYAYVWNNPLNLVDLDGLWPQWARDAWDTTTEFVDGVVDGATNVVNNVVDWGRDTWNSVTDWYDGLPDWAQTGIQIVGVALLV